MPTIYCPMKRCPFNDAKGEYLKEGICIKAEIEMHVREEDYCNFPYCPEYVAKYWPEINY